jgi:hypothetical protein
VFVEDVQLLSTGLLFFAVGAKAFESHWDKASCPLPRRVCPHNNMKLKLAFLNDLF